MLGHSYRVTSIAPTKLKVALKQIGIGNNGTNGWPGCMKFCELFGNYFSPSLRKSKNTVKTALGDEKSICCIGFLFGKDRKNSGKILFCLQTFYKCDYFHRQPD
jgi:hypothetical protein